MKTTTLHWLEFAKVDLLTCEKLLDDVFLTNVVAFHTQQVVEKCFKAIFEDKGLNLPRIHDLTRLYNKLADEISYEIDLTLLQELDTLYTSSRYPGDIGLMPDGKPTTELANQLYEFAKYIYEKTFEMLKIE